MNVELSVNSSVILNWVPTIIGFLSVKFSVFPVEYVVFVGMLKSVVSAHTPEVMLPFQTFVEFKSIPVSSKVPA